MDDFLTYFLAGMFGNELMRKIATRPLGILYLWVIGFFLTYIFFIILLSITITIFIFTDPAADDSILHFIVDSFVLVAVESHPWATLLALLMGLMFALGYHGHYHDKINQSKK